MGLEGLERATVLCTTVRMSAYGLPEDEKAGGSRITGRRAQRPRASKRGQHLRGRAVGRSL